MSELVWEVHRVNGVDVDVVVEPLRVRLSVRVGVEHDAVLGRPLVDTMDVGGDRRGGGEWK